MKIINQMLEEELENLNSNDDNYDILLIMLAANYPRNFLKTRLMKFCWFFFELGNLPQILKMENYSMQFEPSLLGGSDTAVDNNLSIIEYDGLIQITNRVSNLLLPLYIYYSPYLEVSY